MTFKSPPPPPLDFLVKQILYLLDGDSIAHAMVVCKNLFRAGQSESLWQKLCERHYPVPPRPVNMAYQASLDTSIWKSYQAAYINRPRVRTNGWVNQVVVEHLLLFLLRELFIQYQVLRSMRDLYSFLQDVLPEGDFNKDTTC